MIRTIVAHLIPISTPICCKPVKISFRKKVNLEQTLIIRHKTEQHKKYSFNIRMQTVQVSKLFVSLLHHKPTSKLPPTLSENRWIDVDWATSRHCPKIGSQSRKKQPQTIQ